MQLLDRLRERFPAKTVERLWLSAAAAVLGVGAGVGVAAFRGAYHGIQHFAYEVAVPWLAQWGQWTSLLIPVAGGLLAGLLVTFVIGHERHHGVAGIIEAVTLDGGRLRYRRTPAKAVGAAISIGSGASVGPEDPSVQIGANLGSFLGQRLQFPEDRVRMLVAAGAAAGVSAAFGAPMAGVFFALEVILADLAGTGVGLVLVTSVLAALTCGAVSGGARPLVVPEYALRSMKEVPLYLLLGAFLGPCAAVYVRSVDNARALFVRAHRARWMRPMIAGAAVGAVALWLPQVRGIDYPMLESVLRGTETALWMLLALGAAKLVLTGLCIGAGFPGGVFAPALFTGAMLGGAFGQGVHGVFPGLATHPGAFAMAGMAAFLAASVHAPMTAVLLVFEITGDYRMVGAAMCAVAAALLGARWIEPESMYSRPLAKKGFRRHALSPVETQRAVVEPGAVCDGKAVCAVEWPRGCTIARIWHAGEPVTPHGDTVIHAGDELVAVVDDESRAGFIACCRGAVPVLLADAVPEDDPRGP